MSSLVSHTMSKNYSQQNFQKTSFANRDLSGANFSGCDLRETDFTGANLSGADFSKCRTGITPLNMTWIFVLATIVSLVSGYFAMLAARTIQNMVRSPDPNIRNAGIASIVIIVLFLIYGWWRGGRNAILQLFVPTIIVAIIIGTISYASGYGTGMGMVYEILALFLAVLMFVVGTIARAAAGSLSNILFLIVAMSGGMFGKSVGGGIGTVVMAVACATISKKALSGATGFATLQRIAATITRKFGTSFRNAKLTNANFSQAKIHNADFSNADLTAVNWEGSKKINCIIEQ